MSLGWVPMMAAMMLPSAAPAIARRAREHDGVLSAPAFAGVYLGIWMLAGLAVYAVYRPPGDVAAAALVIAGGLYELTPFKRACRVRCRERLRSGLVLGIACLGSSLGLMLVLAGVGVMSTAWMCAIAAVVVAQKLLPPRPALDVPVAVALVAVALI
jgi:predicted metal-binding membrane protein